MIVALRASVAALLLSGCYVDHAAAPELVACEPRISPPHIIHWDRPRPRGRMHACETAIRTEDEVLARQTALGCELGAPHEDWTLHGGCDYRIVIEHEAEIRIARSCEELEAIAAVDPCTRPDRRLYWRPDGD